MMAMTSPNGLRLDRALRKHCQRRLNALRRERASWESHWRELGEHILPRRGRFLWTPNSGERGRKDEFTHSSLLLFSPRRTFL